MSYELAELNIAKLKAPLDSPLLAEFVANLERINALAERSPGFLWRLQGEGADATSLRPMGEEILINMSVWRDVESLKNFVYRSDHAQFVPRRKEWFEPLAEGAMVMWWVPQGHRPSVDAAIAKLEHLRRHGPSLQAFTFRQLYPAPQAAAPHA